MGQSLHLWQKLFTVVLKGYFIKKSQNKQTPKQKSTEAEQGILRQPQLSPRCKEKWGRNSGNACSIGNNFIVRSWWKPQAETCCFNWCCSLFTSPWLYLVMQIIRYLSLGFLPLSSKIYYFLLKKCPHENKTVLSRTNNHITHFSKCPIMTYVSVWLTKPFSSYRS